MVTDEEQRLELEQEEEQKRKEDDKQKVTSVIRKSLPRTTVIDASMFKENKKLGVA